MQNDPTTYKIKRYKREKTSTRKQFISHLPKTNKSGLINLFKVLIKKLKKIVEIIKEHKEIRKKI